MLKVFTQSYEGAYQTKFETALRGEHTGKPDLKTAMSLFLHFPQPIRREEKIPYFITMIEAGRALVSFLHNDLTSEQNSEMERRQIAEVLGDSLKTCRIELQKYLNLNSTPEAIASRLSRLEAFEELEIAPPVIRGEMAELGRYRALKRTPEELLTLKESALREGRKLAEESFSGRLKELEKRLIEYESIGTPLDIRNKIGQVERIFGMNPKELNRSLETLKEYERLNRSPEELQKLLEREQKLDDELGAVQLITDQIERA
jgi:hypothetical protein